MWHSAWHSLMMLKAITVKEGLSEAQGSLLTGVLHVHFPSLSTVFSRCKLCRPLQDARPGPELKQAKWRPGSLLPPAG